MPDHPYLSTMRILTLAVVAVSLGCVSLSNSEPPPPPDLARVTGVVIDSVTRAGVLPGATVALPELSRFTLADESGRFRFDSLPPGQHSFVATHPALDSVGPYQLSAAIDAPGGRVSEAVITTPSPSRIYASICGEEMSAFGIDGVVMGTPRDARSGQPLDDGEVRVRWSELMLADAVAEQVRAASVTVDSGGQFAICGAFADATLELQALLGDRRSGVMVLPGSGQVLRVADVVLGDGVGMAMLTDVADDEEIELLPADTLITLLRAEGPGVVVGRVTDGDRPLAPWWSSPVSPRSNAPTPMASSSSPASPPAATPSTCDRWVTSRACSRS